MPNSAGHKKDSGDTPVTIKKYANRRLYNTATSSYVTLEDLCQMVKEGVEFTVFDAKSSEDITRTVLTQIIVEEESKGQNLLPITFLRQLIGFYGDSLESVVPSYLEHSMASFSRNQEQMRKYLKDTFDGLFPFGDLETMGKQNMALIEKTMKMFTPYGAEGGPVGRGGTGGGSQSNSASGASETPGGEEFDELKRKIETLQQELEKLSKRKDG